MHLHLFRSKEERAADHAARQRAEEAAARERAELQELPQRVATMEPDQVREAASELLARHALEPAEERSLATRAVRELGEAVLRDPSLDEEQEHRFSQLYLGLGFQAADLESGPFADLHARMIIGTLNAGRLDSLAREPAHMVARRGESVFAELDATLLKEVAVREWEGRTQGVSIRIAKGVRYYTGGSRGTLVQTGTELRNEDAGVLAVSSKRTVFLGQRSTMEFPIAKIISFDVFADGIRLHVSSRERAPLFRLANGYGDVAAATIHAVIRELDGD
jgi:hypothetical protein